MELTFTQQSTAFLFSLLLGISLGAFYEVIRIIRLGFNFGRAGTVTADILFMLISSVAVFLFSLAFLLGFVRIYVIAGCFLGFFAFKLTIGKALAKIYCPLISFFRKISHNIHSKLKNFTKKLLKNIYKILYNVSNRRRIFRNAQSDDMCEKRVMDSNEEEKCSVKKDSGSSGSRKRSNKRNKT